MIDAATAPKTEPSNEAIPSKHLIVQVAARALRRVHQDHQVFSLGYSATTPTAFRRLNVGSGIQGALETTVASAFVQEFHSSKVAHGWLAYESVASTGPATETTDEPAKVGNRFYRVEHEVGYRLVGDEPRDTKFLDVVVWRTDERGTPGPWGILPIELKRARLYRKNLSEGVADPKAKQARAVARDVVKLARFSSAWGGGAPLHFTSELAGLPKPGTDVFPHVLVWGVDSPKPAEFFKDVFACVRGVTATTLVCEWIPLAWSDKPEPTSWLWVAYQEFKLKEGEIPEYLSKMNKVQPETEEGEFDED